MNKNTTRAIGRTVLVAAIALGLAACGGSGGSSDKGFELTILHINDHHSNLDPFNTNLRLRTSSAPERQSVSVSMGGFPRVTQAFEELAAAHDNVLKLHGGDAITGTLYYTLEEGRADADLMNSVCFDAMAVGNHEFDSGDAGLRQFADYLRAHPTCRTPLLSANVSPRPGSPLGSDTVQPSVVIERDGQRIGIVGLTIAGKTQNSSRPDQGTVLLDELSSAQAEIDRLRAQGIDKIILLTHVGYAGEVELARQLSGVDVVVGGDSHSLLGDDSLRPYGLNPVGPYPTVLENRDGDRVCVVQAWQYSAVVGELKVSFDRDGRVRSCEGQPHILIGDSFGNRSGEERAAILADIAAQPAMRITQPSPTAEAVLASYRAAQVAFGQEVVASASRDLCLRRVPGTARDGSRSSLAGCNTDPHVIAHGGDVQQIVAEAFLRQGQRFGSADLSLQNGGGVRVDLAVGNITVGNIYTVLPFRNTLVRLTMTGAEVKSAIEDAMDAVVNGSTGSYPYAGGLRWHVDLGQARGSRVSNLEIRGLGDIWLPLNPAGTYRVITNDFIADGQDGYLTLGTIDGDRRVDTFLAYADSFLQYARENLVLMRPATSAFSTQSFVDTD
ncbi:MAG TPA: 5'-nucleotidase C-terminal domain-containing protein [Azoarcus taiwanensis]|nr:5'-nucleotidase C-terminal domain-containing protein [Azoarcus taiwanensis]